ncbi:MAG: hypothetical protein KIH69_022765 [Anaerolineae bacterium]|nr:hypothetical protein [Anaerolineae bacterium]
MMMPKTYSSLPNFTFHDYQGLLESLLQVGYKFEFVKNLLPASSIDQSKKQIVYLRHDIDFHLNGVEKIALIENRLRICATYYVLLTEQYNVLHPRSLAVLEAILRLGHDIGLHYDLSIYPTDLPAAHARLRWEIDLLRRITGRDIKTIVTHQPFRGIPDPFRALDIYIHPHNSKYQENLTYISDSARSWRDENLLNCFKESRPQRLLLNTHPEFWLSDEMIKDRWVYSKSVMHPNINAIATDSLRAQEAVWRDHIATKLHDAREVK